jgi:hypothetical protein
MTEPQEMAVDLEKVIDALAHTSPRAANPPPPAGPPLPRDRGPI